MGDRIVLAALRMHGLDDMWEYSQDGSFFAHLEFGPPATVEEMKAYLEKLIERSAADDSHYWFVTLRESKKVIGSFAVRNIDRHRLSAELGYGIGSAYQGQGYFGEALGLVLHHLFVVEGFHRAWAYTEAGNAGSIKGLARVGFKREAVLRDYYRHIDGRWADAVEKALLESEYQR